MKVHELKNVLINDLKLCISYSPNTENDLLHMMEQYLKSENKRKNLLPQIKRLINGEEYLNPFADQYPYSEDDITEFETILITYERNMIATRNHEQVLYNTITQINELNERCTHELIDDWRSPKLEGFLHTISEQYIFEQATTLIETYKGW